MTHAAEARFRDHLLAPLANPIYQYEVGSIWRNEGKRYIRLTFEKCVKQKKEKDYITSCTVVTQRGDVRGKFIWTFKGSTVIPLCNMMNPKRWSVGTQKTHLKGFKWILYLRHRRKTFHKSSMCCACFYDHVMRLSRQTTMM